MQKSNRARKARALAKNRQPKSGPDHIARINALSRTTKTTWLSLLAYLAFVGVTLLAVEDADFFLDTRQTDLPLIGVAIPTAQFFLFGPILGTALYVYLHLYLLKLWEALAAAPPTPNTEPLSIQIAPWLVTDLALWIRGQNANQRRPLDWLSHIVTYSLVFAAGPIVVTAFWMRHWPAHQWQFSLINGVLVVICVTTAMISLWSAATRLRLGWTFKGGWRRLVVAGLATLFLGAVLLLGALATGGPPLIIKMARAMVPLLFEVKESGPPFVSADLSEKTLTPLPPDWLPYQTAKRRFRVEWCARQGIGPEPCGPPPRSNTDAPDHLPTARAAWCDEKLGKAARYPDAKKCTAYFTAFDQRFLTDWNTERSTRRAALAPWAPANDDLRGANLSNAAFIGADLRRALMEGADLSEAQMEGAVLISARMEGADLSYSRLVGRQDDIIVLQSTNLIAATNNGGAIRFVDLRGIEFDARTDFRNAFLDRSVDMTGVFRRQIGDLCQRIPSGLSDETFYSHWRGWLNASPDGFSDWGWRSIAPPEYHDVTPIPPPDGCVWKTGPMPPADTP